MEKVKKKQSLLSNDLMFKIIFGKNENKRFTVDLINSFLNLNLKEEDINILNSYIPERDEIDDRKFEFDILIKINEKDYINLEMQNGNDPNSEIKNTMYVMINFVKKLPKGKKYSLAPSIDQLVFLKDDKLHNYEEAINQYQLVNIKYPEDVLIKDKFNIKYVDVDVKENVSYNKSSRRKLWRKLIAADSKEKLLKLAKKDKMIKEVIEEMELVANNKVMQRYFNKERLIKSQMEDAKIEGSQEKTIEIAKNLLGKLPIREIANVTNLSIEEIKELQE